MNCRTCVHNHYEPVGISGVTPEGMINNCDRPESSDEQEADLLNRWMGEQEWDDEMMCPEVTDPCPGFEATPSEAARPLTVIEEIAAERQRQIAKGYDAAHDDQWRTFEISTVAAAVALGETEHISGDVPDWAQHIIEKWDTRRRLVIAAALLVAEIERFDRATARGGR